MGFHFSDHSRWAGIFFVLSLSLFFSLPARAAQVSFDVNSNADAPDAAPGNGTCAAADGKCTLRAAVQEAYANLTTGNSYLVKLKADQYKFTISGTDDTGAQGDLDIRGDVTLEGEGADKTMIDAAGLDRAFDVMDTIASGVASKLTLKNLTVTNGNAGSSEGGGAVQVRGNVIASTVGASLNVESCDLSNNTGIGGGAIQGGWMNTLAIRNSLISNNKATSGGGGGIGTVNGTVTLINTTISGNSATDNGGGLYHFGGGGTYTLNNVTLANNVSDSDRSGSGGGGGVYSDLDFFVTNSIIAGNTDHSGVGPDCTGAGKISLKGYSLLKTTTGCPVEADLAINLGGKDPLLGPLQSNGGRTKTLALLDGSPAIDAGNPALPGSGGTACEPTDARGITRPQFVACDMGAFERDTALAAVGTTSGATAPKSGCGLVEGAERGAPSKMVMGFFGVLMGLFFFRSLTILRSSKKR